MILVNGRFRSQQLTGVQRVASELLPFLENQFGSELKVLCRDSFGDSWLSSWLGKSSFDAVAGHLWEQYWLRQQSKGGLLVNLCNTAPLFLENQVVMVHDAATLDHPEWFSAKFAAWYRFMIPNIIKYSRAVFTVSSFSKQRLVDFTGCNPDKVHVVYNGVGKQFSPFTTNRSLLLDLGIKRPYILTVGSIDPRKNLGTLLKAWRDIKHKVDGVDLVVVGGTSSLFSNNAVSVDDSQENVRFLGRVDDDVLPHLYSNALLFVYPSIYEGFGLPPLEAMASGTPVIAGNCTALPEVLGDCAVLINPFNERDISTAILDVLYNRGSYNDLVIAGLARAEMFCWSDTAKRVGAVITSLI